MAAKYHVAPRISTSFKSNEAYAQAEHAVRQCAAFAAECAKRLQVVSVVDLPLSEALGPGYLGYVEGVSKDTAERLVRPIDFTDGLVFAKYLRSGRDLLHVTMFPEPRRPAVDAMRSKFTTEVVHFIKSHWDTDDRYPTRPTSAEARHDLAVLGVEDSLRDCLVEVIGGRAALPAEWGELVNAQTYTQDDVRVDASAFWTWLFDASPSTDDGEGTMPEPRRRGWFPFRR